MSTTPDVPSTAEIREFLSGTFTDDELMDFCYDYFRGAYDSFGTRITKGQRIQLLIEYCEKHDQLPDLGRALEKARPDQYDKLFSKSQPPPFNPAPPISDKPDAPRPGTGRSLSTTVTITIGTVAATVLLALFALVVNKAIRLQSEKPIATRAAEAQLIA